MYKESGYNIKIKCDKGEVILANLLYRKVSKYSNSDFVKIEKGLKNPNRENDKVVEYLKEMKYIIPSDCDERQIIEYRRNNLIFNQKELFFNIVLTDACNMRCKYCYEPHKPHIMSDDDKESFLKYIKKNIKNYSSLQINWYGGEPLLQSQSVVEMMKNIKKTCKKHQKILHASMTTNGFLLTPDIFEKLYMENVVGYQVTIDGFKELHNYNRPLLNGEDSYDQIMANLKHIKKSNKRVSVIIRVNVTKNEIPNIYPFICHLKDTFLDDERFKLNIFNVRDWGGQSINELELANYSEFNKLMDKVIKKGVAPNDIGEILEPLELSCEYGATNSFYLDWDLKLYKCSTTVYDKSLCGEVGFITADGDMELDENMMAKWHTAQNIEKRCYECKYYPKCMSYSCPYAHNIMRDRKCEDYISGLQYQIKAISNKIDKERICNGK